MEGEGGEIAAGGDGEGLAGECGIDKFGALEAGTLNGDIARGVGGGPFKDLQIDGVVFFRGATCKVIGGIKLAFRRGRGAIDGFAIDAEPGTDFVNDSDVLRGKGAIAHRADVDDEISAFARAVN